MQSLLEAKRNREQHLQDQYQQLLNDVLDDKEIDGDSALVILEANGKTSEDLNRDVARQKTIRELRQLADTEPALQQELIALNTTFGPRRKELDDELDRVTKQRETEVRDYVSKSNIVLGKIQRARDARYKLNRLEQSE